MGNTPEEINVFRKLLEQVAAVFRMEYPSTDPDISKWKGRLIQDFQEDLRQKVGGSISEKWFYSHAKNSPEKLPRIDVLDLLSKYAGYQGWNAYLGQHVQSPKGNKKRIIWLALAALALIATVYAFIPKKNTYYFCFVDADKKEAITEIAIDVIILNDGESPSYVKSDSLGCFSWTTREKQIRFIAQSPYHKNDTIYRSFSGKSDSEVRLRTDDYALMLDYYSNRNVKDWKRRRVELQRLIADDAVIFELLPFQLGVEIYNKEEFIQKLITPTQSLQKLEVVETAYEDGQLVKLKFRIKQ
ncbi:MAG: hypothetical protein AAF361_04680 [Bacteroidota bacterium]